MSTSFTDDDDLEVEDGIECVSFENQSNAIAILEPTDLSKWPAATLQALNTHFPEWRLQQEVIDVVGNTLKQKRFGFNAENTLFAHSTCPDEINHEEGDITVLMSRYWGEVFHLGGLAGLPFAGKTGFGAFSHHVPKDGNLLVLFAPHVGISLEGAVGRYRRPGQNHDSTACGAAVGAWSHIKTNGLENTADQVRNVDYADFQMQYILREMSTNKDFASRLQSATASGEKEAAAAAAPTDGHGHGSHHTPRNDPEQAEIAKVMFDMVHHLLKQVVSTKFGGRLALIGGIQVNVSDQSASDVFVPKVFQVLYKDDPPIDLMHVFEKKA